MSALGIVLLGVTALVLPATGLPAFAVLLAMAVAGAAIGTFAGGIEPALLTALPARLVNLLESDLLQALPLYVLIGGLLNRLPIADAFFRSTVRLLRGSPAGPAVAAVSIGALLGPMNGSVGASVVALSHTAAPRLRAGGMPVASRHALVAVASTLGLVVPPSLVLILLGDAMMAAHTIAVRTSGRADRILNTQDVFRGALIPAALFLAVALTVAALSARRAPRPAEERSASALRDAAIALGALAFVGTLLVGVASGYFYAVEGAAGGAFVLFVAARAAGRLSGAALSKLLADTITTTGALFALLAAATTFTLVFRALGTDRLLDGWIAALPGGEAVATLVVLTAIGVAALALDAFEIIFVLVPVLMPPLLARVPDASWVAVLMLLTLQTSFLLPPIGYALLMTRGVLGERVATRAVARRLLPYLAGQVLVFAVVFAFPALVHFGQGANAPTVRRDAFGRSGHAAAAGHPRAAERRRRKVAGSGTPAPRCVLGRFSAKGAGDAKRCRDFERVSFRRVLAAINGLHRAGLTPAPISTVTARSLRVRGTPGTNTRCAGSSSCVARAGTSLVPIGYDRLVAGAPTSALCAEVGRWKERLIRPGDEF